MFCQSCGEPCAITSIQPTGCEPPLWRRVEIIAGEMQAADCGLPKTWTDLRDAAEICEAANREALGLVVEHRPEAWSVQDSIDAVS